MIEKTVSTYLFRTRNKLKDFFGKKVMIMNKLKIYEAMNMIDDEFVKEAAAPSDTVSEAVGD